MPYSIQRMEEILADVKARFLKDDSDLLTTRAHERTVTHRIGLYLQDAFSDWHVDCEYNRAGVACGDPKVVADGRRVFPDIIVHKRGTKENLLVIEAKPTWASAASKLADEKKVYQIAEQHGYKHAYTLVYSTGKSHSIEFKRIDIPGPPDIYGSRSRPLPLP